MLTLEVEPGSRNRILEEDTNSDSSLSIISQGTKLLSCISMRDPNVSTPNDTLFDIDFLDDTSVTPNNGPQAPFDRPSHDFLDLDEEITHPTEGRRADGLLRGSHDVFSDNNDDSIENDIVENPFSDRQRETFMAGHDDQLNRFTLSQPSRAQRIFRSLKTGIGLGAKQDQQYQSFEMQTLGDTRHENGYAKSRNKFDMKILFNKYIMRKNIANPDDRMTFRSISINDENLHANSGFGDNHISTTKYNAATFLPKFLFQEFSKYANLFFLFTSAIQQVPNVTPTNRFTTIGTLLIVLIVSAIKESVEDIKRANSDKELNYSRAEVFSQEMQDFTSRKWVDISVGDIIRVKSEEAIPADIVLLSSSEPEGLCYIETANLDGETNLKIKQARVETSKLMDSRDLAQFSGKIESEQPNSSLYTYEGTLTFGGKRIPLSPEQMILRGATLRNTAWIYGIVIFTGHETKLMRNATATPIKRTAVERVINLQIVALFGVLITLALISSIGNVIMVSTDADHLSYLYLGGTNKAALFFKDLLTYWILFSNLVPISLFVTVEMIKYYQAYMIASDLDLYDEQTDTPTIVRTSSLVEELGQIEYIFSDKTGTLTRNVMEFKSCSIAGRSYIEAVPEDKGATIEDGIEVGYRKFDEMKQKLEDLHDPESKVISNFLTLLATCHTVIPEFQDDGSIKYQAASPDPLCALVEGAAMLGYKFVIRKPNSVTIDIEQTHSQLEYQLLNICEFNSTRKRMSAIFRMPDNSIKLFCKGADSVILERLDKENNPYTDATLRHLEDYASEGLRTLCIAMKDIREEDYLSWALKYEGASTTLENRNQKLDDVAELIEQDLTLIGATAIEDKLQDGVPDTIHTLQEAGIKVWVLTGDRQETAINIGMSCHLLSEDMNLLIINEDNVKDTHKNLREKLKAINDHQISQQDINNLALVIDGKSLGFILGTELEESLLEIGTLCKAVICCRVSPLQKALVVKMVKNRSKSLLLAIGDGANDVSMIQAAHVGIGISGMEGMQAARSADFAVAQFKFLKKLLLVHGSWSYQRISQAILYSFYKNIALYMTQFWYVFANAFSGQSIMESWTMTFYNLLFTVLPPFVMGVFDQFVSSRLLDRYPQLYKLGQKGQFFSVTIFWGWVINGFYHSAVTFVGSILFYRNGNVLNMHGTTSDHWTWGVAVYTASCMTVLGKAALVTNQWTKFTAFAIPGSMVFWLVFFPIYASILPHANVSKEYYGIVPHVYGSATFWFMCLVLPVFSLLRDFIWKYYKRTYTPEPYHVVQEMQKYNIGDYRPRVEHFQKAIRRVRQVQRMKKQRGFAFSQSEEGGQDKIIRMYDTTLKRGTYGELQDASANPFKDY
ncbi:LAMI_0F06436g1_1 [Lachancea mirantina]|uniref:Phospholipid-transporting ATPase n=1 Tax=Lachancea mirantina TaxID=1230905 RepID=A0A1G4JYX4_9SACH|nr:LAMI_0F06436g1_1 [Lachancea mirantina]